MKNKKETIVLPNIQKILTQVGENIRLARLRRNLTVELVCERADISRTTLWKVEKGDPSVAFGIYANVLLALNGLHNDLLLIAKDDALGRTLMDLNIKTRKRATKRVK